MTAILGSLSVAIRRDVAPIYSSIIAGLGIQLAFNMRLVIALKLRQCTERCGPWVALLVYLSGRFAYIMKLHANGTPTGQVDCLVEQYHRA